MNHKREKFAILSMIVFVLLFSSDLSLAPTSPTHTLDTSVYHFLLDNGSRLKFDEDSISLGDDAGLWTWIEDNGIEFRSLSMGASDCPDPWKVTLHASSNMTIIKLFESNVFESSISASALTTTTTGIYCGSKGEPRSVEGGDSWSYDEITRICTVTITHSSSETIKLDWTDTSSLGIYSLKIHVTQNKLPYFGGIVSVDGGENKTTDLLGDVVFDVGYGTHRLVVYCGDDQRKRTVMMNGDKTIGFNFEYHPPRGRGDLALLGIPLGFFIIVFVAVSIYKKRR